MKIRDKTLFAFILIFIFMTFAIQTKAEEVADWKIAAQRYYSGNYDEASEILNEYAEKEIISKDDFKSLEYLIKSEIELLNLDKAEELIFNMEESGYKQAELYWLLGRKFLNREGHFDNAMFKKAMENLETSRELGLFGIEQKRDLGQALVGLERFSQAIEFLEEVREKNPRTSDLSALARSYHETEQLQKAIDVYERLIVLKPGDAGAHLTLGNIYKDLDNYQEAAEVYRQGLNSSPDNIALKKAFAETKFFLKDFDEAKNLMLEIVESHPHMYQIHYYLGQIYEEMNEIEQAQQKYEDAIKYNSKYVRGFLALGKLYLNENNHYRAISQFSNAIEINPDHAESYFWLGNTFYKLEMFEAALSEISNALRRNPGHENARELREVLIEKLNEKEIEESISE